MFESIFILIKNPIISGFIALALSLALGIIFSFIYTFVKKNDGITKDFPLTLIFFPFIACALMILGYYLSSSLADSIAATSSATEARVMRYGIALVSVITMTRFRSQQRTTEDITYIFFVTFVGVSCGLGYVSFAFVIELILIITLLILHKIQYPFVSPRHYKLKITIPEDLNYEHAFDDIFQKYVEVVHLGKIRTSDLGTMFTLNYEVIIKKDVSHKEFIDALRERNGNLNIQLTSKKFDQIGE